MNKKILFGIPPKNHVNLAMDELEGLQKLGYECEKTTYSRNKPSLNKLNKLFGVLKNASILIKKLNNFKPDILYLNSRFSRDGLVRDFITIFLIKTFYRKSLKVLIKTHGSDLDIKSNGSILTNRTVLPYLIKNVDVWFFLSKEEKEEIGKQFPKLQKNAHITCNIIDPKRSFKSNSFMNDYVPNDDRFKFFFAGRMIHEKGIFSIVKAIPHFKYKDQCAFIMSGEGEQLDELRRLVKSLKLEKTVYLTGFVPEKTCDHFYANADALVFPTYFDEGFPMTLFKALSSGMPIITTEIRAAKDHLKAPENCLWVDGRSEVSVAEALNKLFEDESLRFQMSKNNLILGENFTQNAVSLETHKVLNGLH